MFSGTRLSDVHSIPGGLWYASTTGRFAVTATGLPSSDTRSPSATVSPCFATAPLMRTRPASTCLSAARREHTPCSVKKRLMRTGAEDIRPALARPSARPRSAARAQAPSGSERGPRAAASPRSRSRRTGARHAARAPGASVWNIALPSKSANSSVRGSSTCTKPGSPPRWEASAPRTACAVAMKSVSARAIQSRWLGSSTRPARVASPGSGGNVRAWMCFGQLKNTSDGATRSAPSALRNAMPFARKRRRSARSITRTPRGAGKAKTRSSGSPGGKPVAISSAPPPSPRRKPGAPRSAEAQRAPRASSAATIASCCRFRKSRARSEAGR